MKHRVDNF